MSHESSLPIQLDAPFARYALLTGATLLVGSKSMKADVVYTLGPTADFTQGSHTLDLNGDGVNDFLFTGWGSVAPNIRVYGNDVPIPTDHTAFNNYILVYQSQQTNAVPLSVGEVIGIGTDNGVFTDGDEGTSGFAATGPLFLGLVFDDTNGYYYYGFAEFESFVYQGFAYETTPYTPITTFDVNTASAPEPDSLGMLALGAAGLEILRRKRANLV